MPKLMKKSCVRFGQNNEDLYRIPALFWDLDVLNFTKSRLCFLTKILFFKNWDLGLFKPISGPQNEASGGPRKARRRACEPGFSGPIEVQSWPINSSKKVVEDSKKCSENQTNNL